MFGIHQEGNFIVFLAGYIANPCLIYLCVICVYKSINWLVALLKATHSLELNSDVSRAFFSFPSTVHLKD